MSFILAGISLEFGWSYSQECMFSSQCILISLENASKYLCLHEHFCIVLACPHDNPENQNSHDLQSKTQ